MIALLVFREKIRAFYGKFSFLIVPVVRFLLSFLTFYLINDNIGFMARLKTPVVPVVLALLCSVLPYGVISTIMALFLLAHVSSVSLELASILLVVFVVIAILYYGFQPGDSYLLLLTPIFFHYKIPYAIPILVGLSGGLRSVIPVGFGTFLYYILQYVKSNAGVLANDTSLDITQKYMQIMKSMISNHMMVVMIASCAVGILVVYLIRRLSVDYAWIMAIVAGAVMQALAIFVGDFLFDVSIPMTELLVGILISMVIAGIYHFMFFAVDYSRTEYTQFEDDDYYYYVKAVPKITVSVPDVKVQKFNSSRGKKQSRGRE